MSKEINEFKTKQENFWAGKFGDEYIKRNMAEGIASNVAFFSTIFSKTDSINSAIEIGANIGLNLLAIKNLLPKIQMSAIEINRSAVEFLKKIDNLNIFHQSINDFIPTSTYDFVLCKGVLIHLAPNKLNEIYEKIFKMSCRYICLAEYYNPIPIEINYRGETGYLFKRDFAGEMLDKFPGLKLISYGFSYHRDPNFPQDDLTWFLLEKTS